jgi:hypothetical protein
MEDVPFVEFVTAATVAGGLSIKTLGADTMNRIALMLMLSLMFYWGCKKKEATAPSPPQQQQQAVTAAPGGAATSEPTPATVSPSPSTEPSLVSLSAGGLIVQKPQEYSEGSAWS